MTREEIQTKVIALAAEKAGVPPAEVAPATSFVGDLEFDSLDLVEYATDLEDAFNVRVPDRRGLERVQTIADVVELVDQQLKQ